MLWGWLVGIGFMMFVLGGFIAPAVNQQRRPRVLRAVFTLGLFLTSGLLFLSGAAFLFSEPEWSKEYADPSTAGRQAWVGVLINAAIAVGPKVLAVIVALIALYVLRGAWDLFSLLRSGFFGETQD